MEYSRIKYHNQHFNGSMEIPKCPVCQITELKFHGFSKGYSKTCSYSCRNKSENFLTKYKETCKVKYGVDFASQSSLFRTQVKKTLKAKYNVENPMFNDDIKQKLKNSNLEKYGTSNPAASNKVKEKIIATKEKNGSITPRNKRSEKQNYYLDVMKITKKSYHDNFYKLNPNNLTRAKDMFHLDHVFSINEGFKNNIPAEIIGHWTNLRLIWCNENTRKNYRCNKSIEQLYEDYTKN